ncbi:MAG: Zn-ribbon domain-containing OB-fold protein [Novosphingobium sp.]
MRAIAEGLFTDETPVRLVGGRDRVTGRIVFPCPSGGDYDAVPLSRRGTLWSYTVQRYRPKTPPYAGPEAFRPWAVGYVELPGETIVEARLANVALDAIRIGMPLELTQVPLDPEAADPVLVHAFQPAEEPA